MTPNFNTFRFHAPWRLTSVARSIESDNLQLVLCSKKKAMTRHLQRIMIAVCLSFGFFLSTYGQKVVTIPQLQQVPLDSLNKLDVLQADTNGFDLDKSPYWHLSNTGSDTVRITGVVIVKPRVLTYTLARYDLFIQDTTTGQLWSGLQVLTNDTSSQAQSTGITNLDTGMVVTITGRVCEFGTQNNSVTELLHYSATAPIYTTPPAISVGTTLPARPSPKEITLDSVAIGNTPKPSRGEKYESMYVIIRNVTVASVDGTTGRFTFQDAAGNVGYMYDGSGWYTLRTHKFSNSTYTPPPVGAKLSFIRGVLVPLARTGTCGDYAIMPLYPGSGQLPSSTYVGDVVIAPPTISSFNPVSGPVGTTVTISGSNFNPLSNRNVVYFGAVRGSVTSGTSTGLTVTVPAGASYAPITVTDTTTGLEAYSNLAFTLTFGVNPIIDTTNFLAAANLTTGIGPAHVAITDFDGDGRPDIVVTDTTGSISVLRNTSVSNTVSFAPKVDFVAGSFPNCIATGDFDGDGKPDIAVTNSSSNTISVFRNTCTSGTISFASRVDFATGSTPIGIAIRDLDGDGKSDIVVANVTGNSVSVFQNTSTTGSISFAPKIDIPSSYDPCTIAIGDLDGDTKPDIAVANAGTSTVSVFRNTSTNGKISFATEIDFATGGTSLLVTIADVDGDGKMDLITGNSPDKLRVSQNTSTVGNISFVPKVDLALDNNTALYALVMGDINGDGKPDIVATNHNGNTFMVFRNTSASGIISFDPKVDFTTTGVIWGISIGDLNGDGRPDWVVANNSSNTVSVLRNVSSPTPPTIASFAPTSGPVGTSVTITGTNFNPVGSNDFVYFGAVKATATSASPTSLTVTVPTSATSAPLTVTDTTTHLTAYSSVPFLVTFLTGKVIGANAFAARVDFAATGPEGIAMGDLDGDGKPDLVVANATANTISVFRNTGTSGSFTSGSFAAKVDFAVGTTPEGVLLADLDGDGKLDIIVTNQASNTVSILQNTSTMGTITTGSFAAKVDFTTGTLPWGIAVADIDGDGKPDLLVVNQTGNSFSVLRNTSATGGFTTASFASKVDFTTGTKPYELALGDLDGDGRPDVAVANEAGNTLSVFRNAGVTGTISASSFAAAVTIAAGSGPYGIAIADLDGDGKADLAVTNYNSSTISLFRNVGTTGSITTSSFAARVDFVTGTGPYHVVINDLDGDGKPDLVVANQGTDSISVLRNTSTTGSITSASFAPKVDFATASSASLPWGTATGDLDGDGKPDLVVANEVSNTVSVLRNTITVPNVISFGVDMSKQLALGLLQTGDTVMVRTFTGVYHNKILSVLPGTSIYRDTVNFGTATGPMEYKFWKSRGANDAQRYEAAIGPVAPYGNRVDTAVTGLKTLPTVFFNNDSVIAVASVSPQSGPIGSSVTLTGYRFNPTAPSNVVRFGAVKAAVTAASTTSLTVAVPTGASYGAISVTDTAIHFTAYSSAPFSVTYLSSRIVNASSYATKVDFTAGTTPVGLAVADIDGDGNNDIVQTNSGSATVSVYRNTSSSGVISASSFAGKVDFATGSSPYGVAVGDLDGDGKPDLVVTNYTANTISVFRNTSSSGSVTSGSFAAKVDFTTGTNPWGIAIADIDGDGKPDIIVTNNGSNTVSVFRNTSVAGSITSGSFASKVDFAAGTRPMGVGAGDIDGDGKPDLVVVNTGANTVSILMNTSSFGSINSGSFASKVDFNTGSSPVGVVTGDIDGDGKPDVVVANSGSMSISVLRNISTTGSITAASLAAKVDFSAGASPYFLALGDADGDGKVDVAVTNWGSNTVSLFKNGSTVGSVALASQVTYSTATNPYGIGFSDLDGDGKPDLAVANGGSASISVLRNTVSPPPPPIISSFSPTSGPAGASVTITGTNLNANPSNDAVYFGAAKAAVTNATATTLTVTVPTGASYSPISVTDLTTGLTAYSAKPFVLTFAGTGVITSSSFATKADFATALVPRIIAAGDLDGDGKPDLAVTYWNSYAVSVFRNTSTINSVSFASRLDVALNGSRGFVRITDLDGDGKPDLIVTNGDTTGANPGVISVFRNTSTSGNISFAAKVDFALDRSGGDIGITDLDGDGKPDMAVPDWANNTVYVFRNTSTPGAISFAPKINLTTGTNPWDVATGDIDGDGEPDLAVTNQNSHTVSIYRNTCSVGNISFASKVDFVTDANTGGPDAVAIGDLDGDGKPELAITSWSDTLTIFRNTSTAGSITGSSFAAKVNFLTGTGNGAAWVAIGDLDGDGKPDLAVADNGGNAISVFQNKSTIGSITTSSFATNVKYASGSMPNAIAIADLDGDGKPDLAVTNNGSNTISVLRNAASAAPLSESEPNNIASQANQLSYGDSLTAAIFPLNDIDYYKFGATAGDTVTISIHDINTSTLNGELRLFSSTGYLVAFDDDYLDVLSSRVSTRIDTTGTYYIRYAYCLNGSSSSFPNSVRSGVHTVLSPHVESAVGSSPNLPGLLISPKNPPGKGKNAVATVDTGSYGLRISRFVKGLPVVNSNNSFAFNVKKDSAQIEVDFYPNGLSTLISIQYGLSASYGSAVSIGPYIGIDEAGTSAQLTGLTPNSLYHYRIGATNSAGPTVYGTDHTFTTSPVAPTNLTATSVSSSQINLSWGAGANGNPSLYRIVRSFLSSSGFVQIDSVAGSSTSYNNMGLTASTTYYYSVYAVNSNGPSAASNQASATTASGAVAVPSAPTGLSAAAVSASQINLSWTASSTGSPSLYRIFRSITSGSGFSKIDSVSGTVTTYSSSGLNASTTYYYLVYAVNSGGQSVASNQANATTTAGVAAPSAPTGLNASVVSSSQIYLSWAASASGSPTLYRIFRSTTSGSGFSKIDSVGGSTTTYNDSHLNVSTAYYYLVYAVNAGGQSVASNQSSATTLASGQTVSILVNGQPTNWAVTYTYGIRWSSQNLGGNVDIKLSTDNGLTFSTTIASNSPNSETFSWTVPSAQPLSNACMLKIESSLNPAIFGLSNAFAIVGGSVDFGQPATVAATYPSAPTSNISYRLISFPGDLQSVAVSQLKFNGTQDDDWKLFSEPGSSAASFIPMNTGSILTTGQGYWFIQKGMLSMGTSFPTPSPQSDGTVTIFLTGGTYSIIGNPFNKPIPWSSVLAINGLSSRKLYSWNDSWKDTSTYLQPGVGYYISSGGLASLKIPYAKFGFPGNIPSMNPFKADWRLQLIFATEVNTDDDNFIGIAKEASEGKDAFEYNKPPLVFDGSFLYMRRSDWGGDNDLYYTDYRSSVGNGQTWNFEISNPSKSLGTVTVMGIDMVPSQYDVSLVNEETGVTVDLRRRESMQYGYGRTSGHFKVIVGPANYVEKQLEQYMPKEFSLEQNYPNPFNPSTVVTFKLPREAPVKLEVFSLLGQRVKVLVESQYEAGVHQVVWTGVDDWGSKVPSGVYFCRLVSGKNIVQTRKMLLTK